jgi:hypothetical protein
MIPGQKFFHEGHAGIMLRGTLFTVTFSSILPGMSILVDRLCGLAVKVPDNRSRGPGFDTRRYQMF